MTEAISFLHTEMPVCEPLHYTACGLDTIYLASGYQKREIGGETYISVRDVEELHKAIALALVTGRKVLSGAGVRFLRKDLDLTQRGLGELMGISDQSVARYEKGAPLDGPGDGLLRALVMETAGGKMRLRQELERIREADDVLDGDLTFGFEGEWRNAA